MVVTPGITIRDRLGVLHPKREDSYYRERDLLPAGLWEALPHAQVQIVNYHAFLPRDAKEIQGAAANTRKLLRGGKLEDADAFRETPELVAARILRGFGAGRGEIVVLNDEAHHCYQDRLSEHPDPRPTRTTGIETARRGSGFAASSTSSASPGSRRFTTSRPRRTSSRGPATTRVSSFPG